MSAIHKTRSQKPFWELTDEEKTEATKEFDREFIIDTFREMTPAERAEWERVQRRIKLTNPHGVYRSVKARLPSDMIKELDALAKKRKISRSKLIRLGLGVYLAHVREKHGGA